VRAADLVMSMFLMHPTDCVDRVSGARVDSAVRTSPPNDVSSATIAGTRPGTSDSAELVESRVALGVEYN